jgi:potassium-dependent mechanosensitive channel
LILRLIGNGRAIKAIYSDIFVSKSLKLKCFSDKKECMENWKEILSGISYVWHKKLLTIQGIKLSFGNLFLGLLLLLMATRLSKLVSKWISKKLIVPMVQDKSAISVYQTFAFYGVQATFIVAALTIAGIPLSVFTVIGGALAIGVGFGSQNIVNNFISGLILMIERPVKVGDVVEIDGFSGTIISIGTRSTKLKTPDNKHFVVPNSFFLEKSVLNWTYVDPVVRTEIKLGVAYNSDLNLVKGVTQKVLDQNPLVEKSRAPHILFEDFGDSALILRIVFWCDLEKIDTTAELRSDLRFAINEAYRQNHIEMSYPQRDVNFKTATPLDIRIHPQ